MKCRSCPNDSDSTAFVKGKNWCKPCFAKYQAARRKELSTGVRGRPPKRANFTHTEAPTPAQSDATGKALAESISTPQKRFQFMVSRHARRISDFESQMAKLDSRIHDAEDQGLIADLRFYTGKRQDLSVAVAAYDLKMSKELQVWQEFAASEDAETPVSFHLVEIPTPPGIIVPCVNDTLQVTADTAPQ